MKKWSIILIIVSVLAACNSVETHYTQKDDAVTAKAEELKLTQMDIVAEESVTGTDSTLYVFQGEKESGETMYYVALVESQENGYIAIETLHLRTPQSSEVVSGDYISAQFLTPHAELELTPYEVLLQLTTGDTLLVTFL